MATVKILIATHKPYEFPKAKYYVPIHVGKALAEHSFGVIGDDSGDNISVKNGSFCELTALYWAWKNHFFADSDYVGLVHYRRYFKGKNVILKNKRIASDEELLNVLNDADAIVAKKRNYYIETVYEQYKHAHYSKDLDLTRDIIERNCQDYLPAFSRVMQGKTLHLFNMCILKIKTFTLIVNGCLIYCLNWKKRLIFQAMIYIKKSIWIYCRTFIKCMAYKK
ncbi:DUF4422 domain-containing protein [Pasteurellaceae bacterium LIM206]|nr:DUF4422 domain-containing protein [Pasteurellaceae bacterium LIM206]